MTPAEYARRWAAACEKRPNLSAWEIDPGNYPTALLDVQYLYFDDPWFVGDLRGSLAATVLCFLAAILEDEQ